jgi:hypothetical protein
VVVARAGTGPDGGEPLATASLGWGEVVSDMVSLSDGGSDTSVGELGKSLFSCAASGLRLGVGCGSNVF